MKNLIHIGKIAATHGLKGELVLEHSLGKVRGIEKLGSLFLETLPGSYLPYFIRQIRVRNEREFLVALEDINSPELAKTLLHKKVWLNEEDFKRQASKQAPISLLGFHIISGAEDLGEIVEVIEQPMQILCRVIYREKEILIPLHGESLLKIDRKKRKVFVELPEGLMDIYR